MHIIQINASYKPAYVYGGPTMSVSKLSEELLKSGIDTEVFTTTANGDSELPVKPGKKVIVDGVPVTYFRRISKGNSHFSPALLRSLWYILRQEKSIQVELKKRKIIHIHAWWNFVSVGACIIALLLNKNVLLSPRGTLSSYSFGNRKSLAKNIFHHLIGKSLLSRCHFHVSTEKEKIDVFNIINPKSITVIANFVRLQPTEFIQPISFLNRQILKILFLSRIEEKKGLDILFNALENFKCPFLLTIGGFGDSAYVSKLQALVTKLNLEGKVVWIGMQSHHLKFDLLADNDLMILPSHDESFANIVIESLSVGTAVLISNNVGLADYVTENNFGWSFNNDATSIMSTLTAAYLENDKRNYIRTVAPGKVKSDFADQSLIIKYRKLYKAIN